MFCHFTQFCELDLGRENSAEMESSSLSGYDDNALQMLRLF